jgi:hypothetical protein
MSSPAVSAAPPCTVDHDRCCGIAGSTLTGTPWGMFVLAGAPRPRKAAFQLAATSLAGVAALLDQLPV